MKDTLTSLASSGVKLRSRPWGMIERRPLRPRCRIGAGMAKGITFVTLEDEAGVASLIIRMDVWKKFCAVARTASAFIAHGMLQNQQGVIHMLVAKLQNMNDSLAELRSVSRDFHGYVSSKGRSRSARHLMVAGHSLPTQVWYDHGMRWLRKNLNFLAWTMAAACVLELTFILIGERDQPVQPTIWTDPSSLAILACAFFAIGWLCRISRRQSVDDKTSKGK